jgi:nucleolar protein 12
MLTKYQAGPVQPPPKTRYQDRVQTENDEELSELEDVDSEDSDDAEDAASADSDAEEDEDEDSDAADSSSEDEVALTNAKESMLNGAQEKPAKKRKRGDKEEEVEDTYMRKLAREELKEEEQRLKKRKTEKARAMADSDGEDEDEDEEASEEPRVVQTDFAVPKHETMADGDNKDSQEVEKASRTVFLGNVSTECLTSKSAEKALKKHLESFIADLADNNPPHKIESIRFRSTAFDNSLPKRAAYAKKEIKDSTTRSTNAYAVYTTKIAAREAVKKLNGSVLLKRHLHVDSLAHPTKIDHRRCVFVGNLPFVDDESQTPTAEGEVPKNKKPASDIEEGLWTHFAKAGKIESVRVVRDAATRVGKGFAYVQFYDENGVEAALHYNEQKYPPMLPRKLRVTRCRAEKKNKKDKPRIALPTTPRGANGKAGYVQKLSAEQKSIQGRARSMLGKVAKAQTKEGFVFEGHRAKEGQGKTGLKFKGSGGKKKGPNGRKSRSTAWKGKSKTTK